MAAARLKLAAAATSSPAAASATSRLSSRCCHLSRGVEEFAKRTATAVRLEDLYRWGCGDNNTRMRFARFLHREIAIRNAQLCQELRVLPFGLPETSGVSSVVSTFGSYVDLLAESPRPKTEEDDGPFTELLQHILDDGLDIVSTLGAGTREVQESLGEEGYEKIRSEVDLIFDRFFMKRIGLRFLLQHYIESANNRPGTSGIIHDNVQVGRILRREAQEARKICQKIYGAAPEVVVSGDGQTFETSQGSSPFSSLEGLNLNQSRQFTYVPTHLQHSCCVLLQNACFSVAEAHFAHPVETRPPGMPPVTAVFVYGEDEVSVKVCDEGGGIPRSMTHLSWSYFCTPDSAGDGETPRRRAWRHSAPLGRGSPPGAGLPLARLHARYYGGNLLLKTIDGFGTDAYLFLNRLGQSCENLPHGVRVSSSMRDSSLGREAMIDFESLGNLSPQEDAFLKRRLAHFRQQNEEAVASLSSLRSTSCDIGG